MACVFGEMRTLKTSERAAAVSPKSVLFGEKEYLWKKREEITQPRHCARVPWESRHEEFTKVCPRATLRIAQLCRWVTQMAGQLRCVPPHLREAQLAGAQLQSLLQLPDTLRA
jgi:hypothetical protein